MIQGVPNGKKIFIEGNLNGHVEKHSGGFERARRDQGYGVRNESKKNILDFARTCDLILTNT